MEAEIDGCPVLVSQTGFSGVKGCEVYVRDSTIASERLWYAIRSIRAEVCEVPFISSAHPSAREQAKAKGRDSAD